LEVREARTEAEVEAAGRVTVAANAEFAPTDPDDPFVPSWARYLTSMADAAGRVVGTVTTEWMTTARAMYERAGCHREPEGDAQLPGVSIVAYAAEL
jgi:hypothetical protein